MNHVQELEQTIYEAINSMAGKVSVGEALGILECIKHEILCSNRTQYVEDQSD